MVLQMGGLVGDNIIDHVVRCINKAAAEGQGSLGGTASPPGAGLPYLKRTEFQARGPGLFFCFGCQHFTEPVIQKTLQAACKVITGRTDVQDVILKFDMRNPSPGPEHVQGTAPPKERQGHAVLEGDGARKTGDLRFNPSEMRIHKILHTPKIVARRQTQADFSACGIDT